MFTEVTAKQRAHSWQELIDTGFNTAHYQYSPLPEGEWLATLDAKQWGRRVNILCFFTAENGIKYKFSAFLTSKSSSGDRLYTPQDRVIDFSSPDIQAGQQFILTTSNNAKGNPIWKSASLFSEPVAPHLPNYKRLLELG